MESEKIFFLCRELFFSSFFNRIVKESTQSEIIRKIFVSLNCKYFDFDNENSYIPTIIESIYVALGHMLNTKVYVSISSVITHVSLIDYFVEIEKKDYHTEDLFTDLHLVCLTSIAHIIMIKPDVSTAELMKHATIALFHKIGKNGSFPFSEELGCGVLQYLWTFDFKQPFTKDIWEEICRTICAHMCNYEFLTTETFSVKENLMYLSFGDYFKKTQEKSTIVIDVDSIIGKINKTFSPDEFFKVNNFSGITIVIKENDETTKFVEKILSMANVEYEIFDVQNNFKDMKLYIKSGKVVIIKIKCKNDIFCLTMNNTNLQPKEVTNSLVITVDSVIDIKNIESITALKPKICFVVSDNQNSKLGYSELTRQLLYFTSNYIKRTTSPFEKDENFTLLPDLIETDLIETNYNVKI
jgi:hypothetical protein